MCRGEGFLEGSRERDDAVFTALALGDPDAAGVEVDVGNPDPYQLVDPDPGVQQGLDQYDVAGPAGFPDGVVERADLGFGRHVGQLLGRAGDLDAQFLAQVPEQLLEVGVVGPLAAQVPGELAGLCAGPGSAAGPAASLALQGGVRVQAEAAAHVEPDLAIGGDVRPEQRGQAAFVLGGEPVRPTGYRPGCLGP